MREALDVRWFLLCRTLARAREKAEMAVAWRLPRWLVMWASVRMIAHATTGQYGSTVMPELSAMDALKRWDVQPHYPLTCQDARHAH